MDERRDFIDRLPGYTVPAILLGVPALFWVLTQVMDTFYADVVWKYYWGPIVADTAGGAQTYEGVKAFPGYNRVNTLSWAVLLGVCVVGLVQLMRRTKTEVNTKLILGATAWVVAGSLWHVLEDTNLMAKPLQYFFITPIIYLLFAAFGVLSLLIGKGLQNIEEKAGQAMAMRQLWLLMIFIVLGYTVIWAKEWSQMVAYVNPLWVALAAAVTFIVIRLRAQKGGRIDATEMVSTLSIGWYIVAFVFIYQFINEPWSSNNPDKQMQWAFVIGPILSGALAGLVYLAMRGKAKTGSIVGIAYTAPLALLLIFSQSLDGISTALGLDLNGYEEKHVASGWVIDNFQTLSANIGFAWGEQYPTFMAFVPLKIALALLVVYAVDVSSQKSEQKPNMALMYFIKFAVIMVGLGPAVRNLVRLSLGV